MVVLHIVFNGYSSAKRKHRRNKPDVTTNIWLGLLLPRFTNSVLHCRDTDSGLGV